MRRDRGATIEISKKIDNGYLNVKAEYELPLCSFSKFKRVMRATIKMIIEDEKLRDKKLRKKLRHHTI